jgi:hypothetical protein
VTIPITESASLVANLTRERTPDLWLNLFEPYFSAAGNGKSTVRYAAGISLTDLDLLSATV